MTQAYNLSQFANKVNSSGQADLSTAVTGTLPIANGGTNNGSLAVTAGGVLYTDGSKVVNVGVGTAGQALTSNGSSAPTWQAASGRGGASYATLSVGTPNITLTSSSDQTQIITATAEGQTITLPDMTTCTKGSGYFYFYNTSSYPVGVKDAGGTVREYLYPSTSGSPIAAVALNIQENSTANGVWHIHNPISAGSSNTNNFTQTTGLSFSGTTIYGMCQVTGTQYVVISTTDANTWYATLITLNTSTKALSVSGSSVAFTLNFATNSGLYFSSDSNKTDKGIVCIGQRTTGGVTKGIGFAIVSGTLYVSSVFTQWTPSSSANTINPFCGILYTNSNDCFITFGAGYPGGDVAATNAALRGYKITVSGTTVTATESSGSVTYAALNNGDNTWQCAPTSYTTYVINRMDSTASPGYASYNTSTNTITSGTRTSQTSRIAGVLIPELTATGGNGGQIEPPNGQYRYIFSSDGSRVMGSTTIQVAFSPASVANIGTASVTVTATTLSYKSFAAKSYGTISTGVNIKNYYPVSSSSYNVFDAQNLAILNCDPTNNNFNYNTCSFNPFNNITTYSANGWYQYPLFWISSTQIAMFYNYTAMNGGTVSVNIITPATPFVS